MKYKISQSMIIVMMVWFAVLVGCTTQDAATPSDCQQPSVKMLRHHSGLRLGDVKAKKLSAKHVLRTPAGFDVPPAIDNGGYFYPVTNQGDKPWCAAYALEYIIKAQYWRTHHRWPANDLHTPIYAGAKRLDGDTSDGTTLENAIEASTNQDLGIGPFTIRSEMIVSPSDIPYAIHAHGAVYAGLSITSAWEIYKGIGLIAYGLPELGGHAQVIDAYNVRQDTYGGVNTWDASWGNCGHWNMGTAEFGREFQYGFALDIVFEQ